MSRRLRLPVVCFVVAGLVRFQLPWPGAGPPPPQPLTVELASGRKFTGLVDAKTNDQQLVLCFTRGSCHAQAADRVEPHSQGVGRGQPIGQRCCVRRRRNARRGSGVRVQKTGDRDRRARLREGEAACRARELPPTDASGHVRCPAGELGRRCRDRWIDRRYYVSDVRRRLLDCQRAAPSRVELFAPQQRVFHHAPLSGGDTLERLSAGREVD